MYNFCLIKSSVPFEHSQRHSMVSSPWYQNCHTECQKRKLQASIFDEYRYKNSEQNISNPNPATHKNTLQTDWIYPRVCEQGWFTYTNQSVWHSTLRKEKTKSTWSSQ